MKIFKKRIEAFHYEELSQDAKETAKNWFLNDEIRSELCTDNIMEEVRTLFPKSELKIQYSVSGCQGDGQIYMEHFVSGMFCSFSNMTRQNGLKSCRDIFLKRKNGPLSFI